VTIVSQGDFVTRTAVTRLRWVVTAATVGLVLFASVRLWFVDGLIRPVTIDGPSMAPALCGASHLVVCGDCGFSFRCDAEHVPADNRAACPNCGFADNPLDAARRLPAEGVLIDRWPLLWRSPRRGDLVAVRTTADELAVKRVAALPGEQLAVRDGNLYSGTKLTRKTRAELHAQWLLVHDNDYRPAKTRGLPPRWRTAAATSRWNADGAGFHVAPTASNSPTDWLEYEHWACTADTRLRGVAAPITDNDGYNQGEMRRPLNSVSDVVLSCRLRASGTGQIVFAAINGDQRFEVEIEPRKRLRLRCQGQMLVDRSFPLDPSRRPVEIEFGLCDQQVLLSADGRVLLHYEYERPTASQPEPLHPLAIGTRGLGLSVDRLRVWRDIYYLDPRGLPRRWQLDSPLDANHFAVLGDNQPVSIDSRHWEEPGVPRTVILGCVYRPFWARSH
jgi:signal peptidase S26 family